MQPSNWKTSLQSFASRRLSNISQTFSDSEQCHDQDSNNGEDELIVDFPSAPRTFTIISQNNEQSESTMRQSLLPTPPAPECASASRAQTTQSSHDRAETIVNFPSSPRARSSHARRQSLPSFPTAPAPTPSTAPRTAPASKNVSFSSTDHTLHQFEDEARFEEPSSIWYNKKDYKKFKKTIKSEVRAIQRRSSLNDLTTEDIETSASRVGGISGRGRTSGSANDFAGMNAIDPDELNGIEAFVCPRTARRVMERRSSHTQAILEEQRRQGGVIRDHHAVRRVSEDFSEWSKQFALTKASLEDSVGSDRNSWLLEGSD